MQQQQQQQQLYIQQNSSISWLFIVKFLKLPYVPNGGQSFLQNYYLPVTSSQKTVSTKTKPLFTLPFSSSMLLCENHLLFHQELNICLFSFSCFHVQKQAMHIICVKYLHLNSDQISFQINVFSSSSFYVRCVDGEKVSGLRFKSQVIITICLDWYFRDTKNMSRSLHYSGNNCLSCGL